MMLSLFEIMLIHPLIKNFVNIRFLVVDSSSIELNIRKRRAKSDRLDAENLLRLLMHYHRDERQVWKVVTVQIVEEEEAGLLHRGKQLSILEENKFFYKSAFTEPAYLMRVLLLTTHTSRKHGKQIEQ